MNSNLESYRFEDFLLDESFQRWSLSTAEKSEREFWNEYYLTHQEQHEAMDQAKVSIQQMNRTEPEVDASHIEAAWEQVDEMTTSPVVRMRPITWMSIAASVAIMIVASYLYLRDTAPTYVSYQTGYGQVSNVTLPDGTEVTLNANSRIKVEEGWSDLDSRKVLLEKGEAFFEVTKTADKKPFHVISDEVTVTVLGTEFNVKSGKSATQVMLREGKINLSYRGVERIMKPGELANVDKANSSLTVSEVEVRQYDSWLERKLVFANTPLSEVAILIQDHYGVTVELSDELKDRRLSGEIPNKNLELLLKALKVTHDLEISHDKNIVAINQSRHKP
ncbi:MAG: hypothetical protein CMP48_01165 [Rickettsiales bacterium]|nr:hypothetical protein [Rickettsiales bacterium]